MTIQKTTILTVLFCLFTAGTSFAQLPADAERTQVATFHFIAGNDMFYVPWKGDGVELERLHKLVDEYREEITAGRMPVYVDSYSASMRDGGRNRELAFIRANRVKSELITSKRLIESYFVTENHTTAYTDADGISHNDRVVVTLRIPITVLQPPQQPDPAPRPAPEPTPDRAEVPAPQPEPMPFCCRPSVWNGA